jgi:glutathione S-transferase
MLKVYGHEKTRAFRVLWLLEELALPYEHHRPAIVRGDLQSPELLALHPAGKVPVLVDGDLVVHESTAIMLHLVDRYGAGSALAVTEPTERAALYQWLFYGASELEQGLWTAARHGFILPEAERLPAAIAWGRAEFTGQLRYLSTMLGERGFLLGERFTAADVLIAQILLWATQQQKLELGYDNVRAYLGRCTARPAFQALVTRFRSQR